MFEFDHQKSNSNKLKHGINFSEAKSYGMILRG